MSMLEVPVGTAAKGLSTFVAIVIHTQTLKYMTLIFRGWKRF